MLKKKKKEEKRVPQVSCLPDLSGAFLFQATLTFSFLKVPEKQAYNLVFITEPLFCEVSVKIG